VRVRYFGPVTVVLQLRLMATESEISATLRAKWFGKDFNSTTTLYMANKDFHNWYNCSDYTSFPSP